MLKALPKVSIILPTFNGAKYIRQSIESCLNQTYKNLELIIVDDGSTDKTPSIAQSYSNPGIKYLRHEENRGISAALNTGFSHSTGEYLTWTSDDNYYCEKAIEVMAEALMAEKKIDFVYASYYKINTQGECLYLKKVSSPKWLSIENCVGPCFLYTRKVYQEAGEYNTGLFLIEDYEYWLRVRKKFRMRKINRYLYFYREHPESLTFQCGRGEPERLIQSILHKYTSPAEQKLRLAVLKFYENDYREAKKLFKRCFWENFFNLSVWRMLAIVYLNPGIVKVIRKIKWRILNSNSDSKLNILYLISALETISGPVKTVYLLASEFAKKGHNVTIVYYTNIKGVLVEKLKKEGIEVLNIGTKNGSLSFIEKMRLIIRLRRLLNLKKINIIHAHHCDADTYALLCSFPRRIKKIITIHGFSYMRWVESHQWRYRYLFFPLMDNLVFVCDSLAKEFHRKYSRMNHKFSVIHNSVPPNFFSSFQEANNKKIRQEFLIPEGTFVIGFIGNIAWCKGIEYLFEALPQVKPVPFRLVLVGGYTQVKKKELELILEKNGCFPCVTFTGFRQDIPQILDALDLFVLSSVEEADPWVLSEAMAKGKPIIATNVGGVCEKIEDGKTGILIPPGNSVALAKAIKMCLEDPQLSHKLGENAKNFIQEKFPFERMIRSYEELYRGFK